MDIIKVIAVGIITAVCAVILRQVKPELTIFAVITGSVIIIFLILEAVGGVFGEYKYLLEYYCYL